MNHDDQTKYNVSIMYCIGESSMGKSIASVVGALLTTKACLR